MTTRTIVCIALVLGAALGAQASPSATAPATPSTHASAQLQALVARHPFYPLLRQYDRQIAALRATLHTRHFGGVGGRIDADTAALRRDLADSAAQIDRLVEQRADDYGRREDDAVASLLATSAVHAPARGAVRADIEKSYRRQYAELRGDANRAMNSYRAAAQAQEQRAYAAYVASVQQQADRAATARAQQLDDDESTLALDLAQKDAGRRITLRAQLSTLALQPQRRRALQAQLAAIEHRENAVVATRRRADVRVLQAYEDTLRAHANADVAHMAVELRDRMEANLAARRDVLAAQRSGSPSLHLGSAQPAGAGAGASADLRAQVAGLRQTGSDRFRSAANAAISAFQGASGDVTRRFVAIRDADASDTAATQARIAALQRDRQTLYDEIVAAVAKR